MRTEFETTAMSSVRGWMITLNDAPAGVKITE
jgi:hypothetical protein